MAVKIRLARRGRKKLAMFDIIVAHGRSPRDGVYIEKIGTYNPLTHPATINIKAERALDWLMKGAQPTETVRTMLSNDGILFRKHLQIGVQKGAINQEEADKKFEAWKSVKDAKITSKIEKAVAEKAAGKKARLDHEAKVNESKAASLKAKLAARIKAAEKAEAKAETAEAAVETAEPVAVPSAEPVAEISSSPAVTDSAEIPAASEPQAQPEQDDQAEKPAAE